MAIIGEPGSGVATRRQLRALARTSRLHSSCRRGRRERRGGQPPRPHRARRDLCASSRKTRPPRATPRPTTRACALNLKPREVRLLGEPLARASGRERGAGRWPRGVELAVAIRRAVGMLARRTALCWRSRPALADDASRQVLFDHAARSVAAARVAAFTRRLRHHRATHAPATCGSRRSAREASGVCFRPRARSAQRRRHAHRAGARGDGSKNPLRIRAFVASELRALGASSSRAASRLRSGPLVPSPVPKTTASGWSRRASPSCGRSIARCCSRRLRSTVRVPSALVASCEGLGGRRGRERVPPPLCSRSLPRRACRSVKSWGTQRPGRSERGAGRCVGGDQLVVPPEVLVPGTLMRRAILTRFPRRATRATAHQDRQRARARRAIRARSTGLCVPRATSTDRRRAPDYLVVDGGRVAEKRGEPDRADVARRSRRDPRGVTRRSHGRAHRGARAARRAAGDPERPRARRVARHRGRARRSGRARRWRPRAVPAHAEAKVVRLHGSDADVIAIAHRRELIARA